MKPNLLKESNSHTAVLEKETVEKDVETKEVEKAAEKEKVEKKTLPKEREKNKQQDIKQEHLENKKSLFNAFNTNAEKQQEKQAYIKQETQQQLSQETEQSQIQQDKTKDASEEEIETSSLIDFKTKPKKKNGRFRFKVVTAIYAVILAVTVGWVGANAVRLSEVQKMIHAQDVKYVQKVAELDNLKENAHNNDQLIPWDQLLPVQSLPLQDVTEYQQESNWFDNIVNWFGKLFGG